MSLLVRKRRPPRINSSPSPGLVYLSSLAPGSTFQLAGEPLTGQVIRAGAGSAVVALNRGRKDNAFVTQDGEVASFRSTVRSVETWSLQTIVRLLEAAEPPVKLRLNLKSQNHTSVEVKEEDVMALFKGNKKVASKGNGKARSKAEKTGGQACGCGCGTQVKRTFAQGHDARFYGWLKKVGDGRMKFSELPASVQRELGDVKGAKARLAAHAK